MRSPRDRALEQKVPLPSCFSCWPGAQHDFYHNATSIQWLHVWQYCVLAHMDPDVNLSKLSSPSNPVIRPSQEGVPHSIGIRYVLPLSDEHWQRQSLIFEPGDGVSRQYFSWYRLNNHRADLSLLFGHNLYTMDGVTAQNPALFSHLTLLLMRRCL